MDEDGILGARRQWFEEYCQRIDQGVLKPPVDGVRYSCPCCGYPTLGERGGYEICELCNWEDDGQDDPHADEFWGGPNGEYSLTEARANFSQYLSMYDRARESDQLIKPSPAEVAAKQKLMDAFDVLRAQGKETWSPEQESHILKLEEALNKAQEQLSQP